MQAAHIIQLQMDLDYETPYANVARTFVDNTSNESSSEFMDYAKLFDLKYDGQILGRNRLMSIIKARGFLTKDNKPTQKAKDLGVLRQYRQEREDENGVTHVWYITHVTPKGEVFFQNLIKRLDSNTSTRKSQA